MQTTSRTFKSIIIDNVLTLFNMLLCIVALFVLSTGSLQNCLFIVIIIINSGIGIVTEIEAKRTLDKLSILIKQRFDITRNNKILQNVEIEQIVVDDLIELHVGAQIPVDGILQSGKIAVNESILTGESNNIYKEVGDKLLSGTLIAVGGGVMRALTTGQDSYAANLSNSAKEFKVPPSDLRIGTNKILKYISFAILPISILLIATQFIKIGSKTGGLSMQTIIDNWSEIILSAAGGVIGMIPEGLVLLTSLNFVLAIIILARKNVLVADLNSVETLARVDEIILDKTGTITDGEINVSEILDSNFVNILDKTTLNSNISSELIESLFAITKLKGGTKSSDAINKYLLNNFNISNAINIVDTTEFDAVNKYSSITISDNKNDFKIIYKLGAPEYIYPKVNVNKYTDNGQRVLVLTKTQIDSESRLQEPELQFIIVCLEQIRKSIIPIIKYFQSSNVNVQIVSGDNESTVRNIAAKVGVSQIVARAKPETKLEIVKKLQKEGHVVAMTGDGVNDILALKEADLGIAMGNAAFASKAVANVVLLNSNFSLLPDVVGQGRRVIANIERVASLFLVKTFYSISLSFFTIIFAMKYPFMPIHLTLVSSIFIGIPAFFLAIPNNNQPYKKGFLGRVVKFSLPIGVLIALVITILTCVFGVPSCVNLVVLSAFSLFVLLTRAQPLLSWRGIMVLLIFLLFILILFIPILSNFFMVYV